MNLELLLEMGKGGHQIGDKRLQRSVQRWHRFQRHTFAIDEFTNLR